MKKPRFPSRYHWATNTFRRIAGVCPSFPEIRGGSLVDCTDSNLSTSWAAGGMISCSTDLLKFASALQQEGKLLRPESYATLTDWRATTNVHLGDMGHGLFRMQHGQPENAWLGHFGGVLGFTTALFWAEKGGCTVCVLCNVGSSHAGSAPSASSVVRDSSILEIALRLVTE